MGKRTTGKTHRMHQSVEAFYNADPRRRHSGEADYGVHWRFPPWRERWRVSYVRETGEIYAACHNRTPDGSNGPVLILGAVPPDPVTDELREVYYRTLESILEGWPEACTKGEGLAWIRDRLETAGRGRETGKTEG
jgi:hypothetical protein